VLEPWSISGPLIGGDDMNGEYQRAIGAAVSHAEICPA
jgi:hypothetical protein